MKIKKKVNITANVAAGISSDMKADITEIDNIKQYLDNHLQHLVLKDETIEKICNSTFEYESPGHNLLGYKSKKPYRMNLRKAMVWMLMVCLLFSGTITVFGALLPAVNNLIYSISPELVEILYPVGKTSEDQGIKMTVHAAVNDNYASVVFFSIQDTEMLGRVDERLDLMDSFRMTGVSLGSVQHISYDEDTQTAYYKMQGSGEDLSGKLGHFSISSMMSNKKEYEWFKTDISLAEIAKEDQEWILISTPATSKEGDYLLTGGGGSPDFTADPPKVLLADVEDIKIAENIDFVNISNIGFVDGFFHIQTKWEQSFCNHGIFKLVKKGSIESITDDTRTVEAEHFTKYFRTPADSELCVDGKHVEHIEWVYDITSLEELKEYELWAWFMEDGLVTNGKWKVDFRLHDSEVIEITDCQGLADKLEITELGVYLIDFQGALETKGFLTELEGCKIKIEFKDETVWDNIPITNIQNMDGQETKWNLNAVFATPISLEQIKTVTVNERVLYQED